MKNGVKMLDIAEKLGISVVTVSNALAGRDGVSDSLRREICETAHKMGYKPSRSRKNDNSCERAYIGKNVGIFTSERFIGEKGTFYWELTAGISNQLSALSICTVYECVNFESERTGALPSSITDGKIDGIIVIGQVKRKYIRSLTETGLPMVLVDFYDNRFDVDSVNSDSFHGGYTVTDYLVEMGHRKIGFFGKFNVTSSINDRFLGYIKCLLENHLEYRSDWTLNDRDQYGTLLTKIDFPEELPTAFVCNCDETAFRVISSLKSKGIRVPEDISIVGYDNYTVSNICIPTITTVEVDINKMAAASVDLIVKKLITPEYTEGRRIISGKLIVKNSVLDIRGSYTDEYSE